MNEFASLLGSGRREKFRKPWAARVRYMTEALYEDHAIAGAPIYPASNNGTQYTGAVDMQKFNRVQFLLITGVVNGSGVVTLLLQQSNNANMQTNVNILGQNGQLGIAGTQNANVAVSASSQIARVEVRKDQCQRRYVQGQVTVTVNQSILACIPMASEALNHPQGGTSVDVCFPNIVVN